jgi:hypothetical protein
VHGVKEQRLDTRGYLSALQLKIYLGVLSLNESSALPILAPALRGRPAPARRAAAGACEALLFRTSRSTVGRQQHNTSTRHWQCEIFRAPKHSARLRRSVVATPLSEMAARAPRQMSPFNTKVMAEVMSSARVSAPRREPAMARLKQLPGRVCERRT